MDDANRDTRVRDQQRDIVAVLELGPDAGLEPMEIAGLMKDLSDEQPTYAGLLGTLEGMVETGALREGQGRGGKPRYMLNRPINRNPVSEERI